MNEKYMVDLVGHSLCSQRCGCSLVLISGLVPDVLDAAEGRGGMATN